jgi:hypothetical protein
MFRLYFLKHKQHLIEQRYFAYIVIDTTLPPVALDKPIRILEKRRCTLSSSSIYENVSLDFI